MTGFVRICSQSELPAQGEVREFEADGRLFCVANVEGAIAVLGGVCPHEEGPLGQGTIEGRCVVCPWHGYAYDVRTGLNDHDPDLKVEVFEAVVEGGELLARA